MVIHAETGMKKPFSGSFEDAVAFELKFRKGNPALCAKNGWPLDAGAIAAYVDSYNAQRLISMGYNSFVIADGPLPVMTPAEKKTPALPSVVGERKPGRVPAEGLVAGFVRRGRSAWAAYREMFGERGPVPRADAERRLAVCAACPKNDTTSTLTDLFTDAAAHEIMGFLGALKDLDLTVPGDARLGVCRACDCPLKAKVFAHADTALVHLTPAVRADLPPNCWMLTETT